MSRKYSDGRIPGSDTNGPKFVGADKFDLLKKAVASHMQCVRFDEALATIWNGVDGVQGLLQANKFIEDTQPFKLVKTDPEAVEAILYSLLEYCRIVAWLIEPVMPDVSRRIVEQLGQDVEAERQKGIDALLAYGGLVSGSALPEPKILFPQLVLS